MIRKRISIKGYSYSFTLRHYWDKEQKEERPWSSEFNKFDLGISFKRFSGIQKSGSGNFISSFFFGVNLILIKFWITFDIRNFFRSK
jgi:hypothetical protein